MKGLLQKHGIACEAYDIDEYMMKKLIGLLEKLLRKYAENRINIRKFALLNMTIGSQNLIKKNPNISRVEIADRITVSISAIERDIPKMANVIRYVGPKKEGHREIIEE